MASGNVFLVMNKSTGEQQLVRADTRGQVKKFLFDSLEISKASASDVLDSMQSGAKVLDASGVVVDEGGGEPGAADAGDGAVHGSSDVS